MKKKRTRVMGEIVLDIVVIEATGAGLHAAGFEFKVDVYPDEDVLDFVMIWKDYEQKDEIRAKTEFTAEANKIINQPNNFVDYITVVAPDHIPKKFNDYGKPTLN